MTLSLRLNGLDYEGFTDVKVTSEMESAARTFAFQTTSENKKVIPVQEGDEVEVVADETHTILTGFVDTVEGSYDSQSHSISIIGRSKTQDLIDCSMKSTTEYEKIGLYKLCQIVAANYGIEVVNDAGDIPIFEDIVGPETGQKAFKFLESFSRRRQVLLTDDEKGNLVITRASEEIASNRLQNILGSTDNNIKAASRKSSTSGLFYHYLAQSQLNPIDVTEFTDAKELSEQLGEVFDEKIRKTRRLEFYTEEATESFTLQERARWELSFRQARNFVYRCKVYGHVAGGELWDRNLLYNIDDDFLKIYGLFLCNKVIYTYDLENGSCSEMFFTHQDAYTLKSEQDKRKSELDDI